MKKTIQIMASIVFSFFSLTLFAQQPEQTTDWNAKKNPIVEEINAKYQGQLIPAKAPKTIEDIFPVLGTYKSSTNTDAATIVISLDPDNKGLVWIEGLPQGKISAMLRKSPAIYKIPAQKTEDGKDLAEGTLIFDKETNTLNIAIGKTYNSANPSQVFAEPQETEVTVADSKKVKGKKEIQPKTWIYTGIKLEKETVKN
jgi:hypothetical protein